MVVFLLNLWKKTPRNLIDLNSIT